MSAGADTKANTMWGGGALQLLEHSVPLDAARDDDGGGNAQPLARKVDLLCRLCALELVDLKWVIIDTAKGRGTIYECQRALTSKGGGLLETAQRRRGRQHEGEQRRCGVADAGIIEVNFVD